MSHVYYVLHSPELTPAGRTCHEGYRNSNRTRNEGKKHADYTYQVDTCQPETVSQSKARYAKVGMVDAALGMTTMRAVGPQRLKASCKAPSTDTTGRNIILWTKDVGKAESISTSTLAKSRATKKALWGPSLNPSR